MPEGIAVGVEDGLATIEFVDRSLRGPALTELFKHADPADVEKRTRPNRYIVPEAAARAAGLLDGGSPAAAAEPPKGYDDGQPDMDWSRAAIDEFAAKLTPPLDTTGEKNKQDAIDAIQAAQQAAE